MASKPLQPSTADHPTSWLGRIARDFWALSQAERDRQLEAMSHIEWAWVMAHKPKHIPP